MAQAGAEVFWDRVAAKYAKSAIKDMTSYEMTLEKTRGYLKSTDHVLEIGAGTGATALLLADACAEILATDLSKKMLEVGRENAWNEGVSNVRFLQSSAEVLPEGEFDTILAHNILHLVEDLPKVLQNVYQSLKPGGLFISKTFLKPRSGFHLEYRMTKLALPLLQRLGKAPYVGFHTDATFQDAFKDAGFDVIERGYFPAGQTRLYLVARKP